MYWQENLEKIGHKSLVKLQLERLQDTVHRAYKNIPFYKKKLDETGVRPGDIKSLRDIQKLPLRLMTTCARIIPMDYWQFPKRK